MNRKQVTAALLAGTLLLAPTTAWAEANTPAEQTATDDFLSLPMQILDFDRDNLFFEYTLYNGLEFNKAGTVENDENGTEYTSGLVNAELGSNGMPQYKEDAKSKIAGLIADATTETTHQNYDTDGSYRFDEVSAKIYDKSGQKKSTNVSLNSNADSSGIIELQKWKATNDSGIMVWTPDSKLMLFSDEAAANRAKWGFDQNHLVFDGGSTATVNQDVTVEENTNYIFSWYANGTPNGDQTIGAVNVTLAMDGYEPIAITTSPQEVHIPENVNTIHIEISPNTEESKASYQMWAFWLEKNDAGENTKVDLFDSANQADWTGPDRGHQAWYGQGDGAICDDPSVALTRDFDVVSSGRCQLDYWIGQDGESDNPIEATVTAMAGGKVLGQDTKTSAGRYTLTVDVPQDVTAITVNVAANQDTKVAIMNVNSYACKVGNDDANAATTAANWKNWNDMISASDLTARQYTEFVLNRLFVPTEGLNTKVDAYDHLILQKAEDGSYVFDSANEVRYDKDNKAIYNTNAKDENGDPVTSGGFFPVDGLGSNQITPVINQPNHNFHFTLHSGGNFVYRKAKNLYFDFSGDDDVYLFINGKLALDLGGAHQRAETRIDLNAMASSLGLEDGKTYSFDFFYMERHTTDSNLKINTNIDVRDRVDVGDKVYQKVTFVFDNLTTTPQDLYVQAYKDGQKMGYPQKYAPTDGTWGTEDLTSQWELPTGSDYRFELVNADGSTYTDEEGHTYTLTTSGETIVSADANGITKTYVYTLRQKPANNGDNGGSGNNNNSNTNTGSNGGSSTQQPAKTSTSTTTVKSTAAAPATKAAPQVAASIPQTSDASHPVLLGILCVASAFGFGIVLAKKKYHA